MDREALRRFVWGGPRGFAPSYWAVMGLLLLISGIVVLVDGQIVPGVIALVLVPLCAYKTIQRQRGDA